MRPLPLRVLSYCAILSVAAVPLACGGGGGGSSANDGSELSSNGSANDESTLSGADDAVTPPTSSGSPAPSDGGAAAAMCTALDALPSIPGDLVGWLQSAPIALPKSEGFKEPGAADLAGFQIAFEQLLEAGPSADVVQKLGQYGFSVTRFDDQRGAKYVVVQETGAPTGRGTFVINPAPARDLWIATPHADSDLGTLEQGANALVTLGARALLITGANRCADAQRTTCDGGTVVCGGKLRISDAAHFPNTYFTAAHKALRAVYANGLAINLHGMETAGLEAAVVSNGTKEVMPTSLSLRLRDAINQRNHGVRRAFSCNDPNDHGYRDLCGTTNVQGRAENGSANVCTSEAAAATDHFLHVEQDAPLRAPGSKVTIKALGDVVACSLPGNGSGCPAVAPTCG